MTELPKTKLVFQSAAHQTTTALDTNLISLSNYSDLSDADKVLFKAPPESPGPFYVLITESTIFHPQGGGQPSDIGQITVSPQNAPAIAFDILTVRPSSTQSGLVLHFAQSASSIDTSTVSLPVPAHQQIDASKRLLFSRLHTAGHVLGASTRAKLESRIANFDELKASHFPDSAGCEFQGLIDGKYKAEVQGAVDELVASDAEVRIEWWTKGTFREKGLERLMPSEEVWREIGIGVDEDGREVEGVDGDEERTRIRVVNIVGAEVYPCGGTHVPTTKGCGKVTVKKISRAKGNSRISYMVD